jgi:hypothetical protein
MLRPSQLLPVVLVVLGTACAGRIPYNPFLVPKDSIFGRTRTVALAPTSASFPLENAAPVYARLDSLIEAELRTAGFAVVPARESGAIWRRVVDSLGGLFDPVSGGADSAKTRVARRLAMDELRARFGADAWLHPCICLVMAEFRNGTATWDGMTESFQSTGGKILSALAGVSKFGTTRAISVGVVVEDMRGTDMYFNRGGVQLLTRPQGRGFADVPRAALFNDPLLTEMGVRLALGPFVRRGQPEVRE